MQKHSIKENEFFPAPGGEGSINGQPGWGTFASPEVSQNSANFAHSDQNKAVDQYGNTRQESPSTASLASDLNAIYAKKDTPTPDEIIAGVKYELGQQIKKDKYKAKQAVLTNLKKDPHFYSKLKMLNIDDESMVNNMSEEKKHPNDAPLREKVEVNPEATKKIFEELTAAKDQKFVVNSKIVDVMKEMWEQKRQRSAWKNEQ
jgi:hypothetical protein